MQDYFLLSVGCWNILGSAALYLMLNKAIADQLLRTWTEMIAYPYDAGKYGSIWLLWAATTNTFLGIVNLLAVTWDELAATEIIYCDLFVYGVLLVPAIATLRSKNFARGHYFNVGLGIFWILWALYVLF